MIAGDPVKLRSVAALKARERLMRRTQPNPPGFVSRLGYNTVCTTYSQDASIDRMSGSSFNRMFAKKHHDEYQQKIKETSEVKESVSWGVVAYREYRQAINNLREDIIDKSINQKRPARTHGKRGVRIHEFSSRSRGKVRDKATAFFRACGRQRTFCTLTFIEDVDDKLAVSILNKFFTQLREDYQKKFKYLWIAERQKNGRIHFHCIFNMRLAVRRYNALWVMQQYNAGLSACGIAYAEIARRYKDETIHEVLNPFDIINIKSVYGLSWYLTKYVTKNGSEYGIGNGFKCAAWHCSRSVSRLFTKTICSYSCLRAAASDINSRVDRKTGAKIQAKVVKGKFYNLFYIENRLYFLPEMSEVEQVNRWILDGFIPDKIPDTDFLELRTFFNN